MYQRSYAYTLYNRQQPALNTQSALPPVQRASTSSVDITKTLRDGRALIGCNADAQVPLWDRSWYVSPASTSGTLEFDAYLGGSLIVAFATSRGNATNGIGLVINDSNPLQRTYFCQLPHFLGYDMHSEVMSGASGDVHLDPAHVTVQWSEAGMSVATDVQGVLVRAPGLTMRPGLPYYIGFGTLNTAERVSGAINNVSIRQQ